MADGTIPARAGEPPPRGPRSGRPWDYPRSCGGTEPGGRPGSRTNGLSPLVRGNPPCRMSVAVLPGTIPARAGEPPRRGAAFLEGGDYPRSCGGTAGFELRDSLAWGLSPLVRGNPITCAAAFSREGTIPARAGEPAGRPPRTTAARDYPRSCGGTPRGAASPEEVAGLSPLVRGNRRVARRAVRGPGTIPARAGEPARRPRSRDKIRDYPRSCGGTIGDSHA